VSSRRITSLDLTNTMSGLADVTRMSGGMVEWGLVGMLHAGCGNTNVCACGMCACMCACMVIELHMCAV